MSAAGSAKAAILGLAKWHVGREISRPWVGAVIGRATRNRIRKGDVTFDVSSPLVSSRTKALIFWGMYESAEQRFIRSWLRPDLDVIELGSSIGVVSSVISRVIEPGRRMICVEANPALIPVLRGNLALNAGDRRVDIVQAAIDYDGSRTETTLFVRETVASSIDAGGEAASSGTVTVPTTTLARVRDELGIASFALVADIEGSEAGLIEMGELELRGCEQLIIELHVVEADGEVSTPDDLVGRLTGDLEFTLRARHGPVCVFDRAATSAA